MTDNLLELVLLKLNQVETIGIEPFLSTLLGKIKITSC